MIPPKKRRLLLCNSSSALKSQGAPSFRWHVRSGRGIKYKHTTHGHRKRDTHITHHTHHHTTHTSQAQQLHHDTMSRGGGRGGGWGGRGRSAPGAGQVLIRETQIDLGMDKIGQDQVIHPYFPTKSSCWPPPSRGSRAMYSTCVLEI